MAQFTPSTEVDFVVIGSGAAGGIMAKQLVVGRLLGRRPRAGRLGQVRPEHELHQGRVAERQPRPDDQLMSDPVRQPNTFRRNDKEKATSGLAQSTAAWSAAAPSPTAAAAGGTCRGSSTKPRTVGGDAGHRTWPTGRSPTTSSSRTTCRPNGRWASPGERVDSPLRRADVEGLPGAAGAAEGLGRADEDGGGQAGADAWCADRSRSSRSPTMGRAGCVNCGMCSGFGCHVKARSSSAVTVLPLAEKTGSCEIRANSYVREISVDASGTRAPASSTSTRSKREVLQKAKAVVLSANGTESARLLLLSKSARFPNGLANSSGVVGKYLMLGNGAGASALFEHPLNDYKGVVTGAGIVDFVPSRSEARLLRRRPHDGARLRHADQLRACAACRRARRAGAPPTRRRCATKPTTR